MPTPWQNINQVVQWAVTDSREFSEDIDEELYEEEVETAIDLGYENRNLGDYYRELYNQVFRACLDAYVEELLSQD
jgi:hypothetical protein